MTTLQKANVQVFTAFDCSIVQLNPIRFGNICGGLPQGGVGNIPQIISLNMKVSPDILS